MSHVMFNTPIRCELQKQTKSAHEKLIELSENENFCRVGQVTLMNLFFLQVYLQASLEIEVVRDHGLKPKVRHRCVIGLTDIYWFHCRTGSRNCANVQH